MGLATEKAPDLGHPNATVGLYFGNDDVIRFSGRLMVLQMDLD